ncbi:MAG: glycosyl hydrolase [Armatimonadetes bacterium]|nr:glycosyl hydrolase [Armatimonadota bacterium]
MWLPPTPAIPVEKFLDSIGANSAISARGEKLDETARLAKYIGIRWFRSGYESMDSITDLLELHQRTGAKFSFGFGSGGTDLKRLLREGRNLAKGDALLAFEGPNEPNNWPITYNGATGGRGQTSWRPVAELQRDLYAAVKADPLLKKYPVWSPSEAGAQFDNTGLQFLKIPSGANTTFPAGTQYADFANVHNYVFHPNSPKLIDNKAWNTSDPSPNCPIDGLYGEFGRTWAKHFPGYSENDLQTLPRVTTETGLTIDGQVDEVTHGKLIVDLYLSQFKRGWSYTALYLLRDRVDEGGNQAFGLVRPDYTIRPAGEYLHNLTTILHQESPTGKYGKSLGYSIPNQPKTNHDLLLSRADGSFDLIVWSERFPGQDSIEIDLEKPASSVVVYDPTIGTKPTKEIERAKSLTLTLTDHPVILRIR